jgi:hypothetical protein
MAVLDGSGEWWRWVCRGGWVAKPYLQQVSVCKLIRKNICPFWALATIGIGLPIKQTLRFWSSDSWAPDEKLQI